MGLIHLQEMTEKNLAAKRANGTQARGAVTSEGKANSAAANLRHGYYAKAPGTVLVALGEDPQEYAELMDSLEKNLDEGLEGALVQRIGQALWKMQRAERIQNGLALKRLQAAREMQDNIAWPQRLRANDNLQRYQDLRAAFARRGGPEADEIRTFVRSFGSDATEEMQEFFVQLKSLDKLPDGPERKAARRKVRRRLAELQEEYRKVCVKLSEQLAEMQSPESLAAHIAPRDERSLLLQRMEDSSLRQLWRLTNMLFRVRNAAQTRRDVKNEGRTDYVYQNKEKDDNLSSENAGTLQETAETD